jgi:DNA helicase-2/ATP-dependent DNA helicase PcrA
LNAEQGSFLRELLDEGDLSPKIEEEIEETKKRLLVLSYSQISTYQQCSLKYRFQYIERKPTKPSPHLAFGETVHNTLRDFHNEFPARESSLEELLKFYETNWLAEGYKDPGEEGRFKKEGERILKGYYLTAIKNPNLPLWLEESFKFLVGNCEVWGRIDRVDRLPGGGWEIIDYKTGKKRIDERGLEADLDPREINENFQLSLYYLGCKEKFKRPPEKVSIWYLKNNVKLSAKRSMEQLRDTKRIVAQVATNITEQRFEPKTGPLCPWCDYKGLCPAYSF